MLQSASRQCPRRFRKSSPKYAPFYASGFPHRFAAAFLACSARCSAVRLRARASPPSLPRAAPGLMGASSSVSSPVARRMTFTAAPITSAGRDSPRGPLGMWRPMLHGLSLIVPQYRVVANIPFRNPKRVGLRYGGSIVCGLNKGLLNNQSLARILPISLIESQKVFSHSALDRLLTAKHSIGRTDRRR